MPRRTRSEVAQFMTLINKSYGELAQGIFKNAFRMLIWSHTVPEAIQGATATVREQYPTFQPKYDPRLDGLL